MIILCEYCEYRCICYDDWVEHLVSNPHQQVINAEMTNWSLELNERSFVAIRNGNFQPTKQDICWFFAKYGLISDAYFGDGVDFCVIQLDKKEYAINVLAEEHIMEDSKLSVRLKTDFLPAEWQALVNPTPITFHEHHLQISTALKSMNSLDAQFDFLIRQVAIKPEETAKKQNLISTLNKILQKRDFPLCELCPYGAYEMGLESARMSYVSLYFDAYGQSLNYKPFPGDLQSKEEIFEKFKRSIAKTSNFGFYYRDFSIIDTGEFPKLRFIENSFNLEFKISFESLLPSQMAKLIAFLIKLDPRLPDLFRFVDYWARYYKLLGYQGRMSLDALYLLLVVFLTMKRIIPSVSVLQSMSDRRIAINDWDSSFCADTEKITNLMSFIGPASFETDPSTGKPTTRSILELMAEFFKMCAHSDLQSQVVCPFIGELLPKSMFQPGNEFQLPKTLDTYKHWAFVQEPNQRFNTNSPLCIQHPFDLSCNASALSCESTIVNFQFICLDTLEIIQKLLISPDASLLEIFKPTTQSGVKPKGRDRIRPKKKATKTKSIVKPLKPNTQQLFSMNSNNSSGGLPKPLSMEESYLSRPVSLLGPPPPKMFCSFPSSTNYNAPTSHNSQCPPPSFPVKVKRRRVRKRATQNTTISSTVTSATTSQPKVPSLMSQNFSNPENTITFINQTLENPKDLIDYPLYVRNPLSSAFSQEPEVIFDSQNSPATPFPPTTSAEAEKNIKPSKLRRQALRACITRLKAQETEQSAETESADDFLLPSPEIPQILENQEQGTSQSIRNENSSINKSTLTQNLPIEKSQDTEQGNISPGGLSSQKELTINQGSSQISFTPSTNPMMRINMPPSKLPKKPVVREDPAEDVIILEDNHDQEMKDSGAVSYDDIGSSPRIGILPNNSSCGPLTSNMSFNSNSSMTFLTPDSTRDWTNAPECSSRTETEYSRTYFASAASQAFYPNTLRCLCTSRCKHNKCKCRKGRRKCTAMCHPGIECYNKYCVYPALQN